MVESVLDTVAKDSGHGSAELWLLLRVTQAGGKAKWSDIIKEYAELRGWVLDAARVKLERAYLKLRRFGLLRKRREQKWAGKPRETYIQLTPKAKALLLQGCEP